MAVKFVKLPASMSVYYKKKMTNQFYEKLQKILLLKLQVTLFVTSTWHLFFIYLLSQRKRGIMESPELVCLSVCLLP